MRLAESASIEEILADFRGDPQKAEGLAEFLGFEPISSPENQLGGPLAGGLKRFLRGPTDGGFGVSELYRVGSRKADPAEAGLWIGVLTDWGYRSSDRDRARRRVSRALVEHVPDRRSLALLVPPTNDSRREAELVFPRTQIGDSKGAVSSVRAHLDLDNPTRFHRDLLRNLRIPASSNLLHVSRLWQQQFSVERVTTKFYQEYAAVRNRMADALLEHNQGHPVIKSLKKDDARAWATRQMGRVLFIWFLQAKRWLGQPEGNGSFTYLLDLWSHQAQTAGGSYYSDILSPLFFSAMATGSTSYGQNPVLGYVPYLNGGLFRRSTMEDRINDAGEVFLPDDVFDPDNDGSLLNLLSRYRFTTRESTPDDQSVDPDPELLGRVFENLYQGDERRNTGTYYTPREIVHFMCREAIDGYLRDTTGVDQGQLNALRQAASGSWDETEALPDVPANALIDALETVRICDPAVGSGAFLLGSIHEIVALRRGILRTQRSYVEPHELYELVSEWKRRTIEHSLFGVDINPEAVEICRLRLWLSMVLDMDEPPPLGSEWSLPNLDFQIVTGDSLVDRVAGVTFKESWPPPTNLQLGIELQGKLQNLETNISRRRREFGSTHRNPDRLRELRDLIAGYQREIVTLHLEDALSRAIADMQSLNKRGRSTKNALKKVQGAIDRINSLLEGVKSSDFALIQKPFLWPIAFPDVLREGDPNSGFDIVLANPPYVRMEKIDNEDELSYVEAFPEVAASRADILVYFYARALQILRPGGWLSFITSNKFMRAGYGASIREHLPATLHIQRVIDFGDLPLFEANGKAISAYPAVLVARRSNSAGEHALKVADLNGPIRKTIMASDLRVNSENVRSVLESLDGLLSESEVSDYPQRLLEKGGWVLEPPSLVRLYERLMTKGPLLEETFNGRVYAGIKTGRNKAFVIDRAKRDELIEEDERSSEIIKPYLRGTDVSRWKVDSADVYVILASRGVDIGQYPAILDHLNWFRDELESRATAHLHPWYELQQPQEGFHHLFAQPKIVWPDITPEARFAYDETGSYLDMTCFSLPASSLWALAIMNSSLVEFLLCQSTSTLQGGFLRPKRQYMARLPIVPLNEDAQTALTSLANEILHLTDTDAVAGIEREIDSLVFELYDLSATERKLVLDWLVKRREAQGAHLPQDWRKLNALQASARAWKDSVDGEQLKQDVRASREIRTRPVPRL